MVALNLFAEVNANLKRAGHAPVSDIARAILFMGMAELPGRISRAIVLEDVVGHGLGEELTRMLCSAHQASRQARAIGALVGGVNGEELLAAALTREGLPYLERLAREPDSELNLAAFNNFLPAPPDGHDSRMTSPKGLDLGARFAAATEQGWDEPTLDKLYTEIQDFTGRSAHDVARSLRRATVEAARAGVRYPTYAPAIRLMSPGAAARKETTVKAPPAQPRPPAVAMDAPMLLRRSQITSRRPDPPRSRRLQAR
ncbi:MAG: hypothetical protein ACU85U_05630 [Gammaproteobacteria bacterium]